MNGWRTHRDREWQQGKMHASNIFEDGDIERTRFAAQWGRLTEGGVYQWADSSWDPCQREKRSDNERTWAHASSSVISITNDNDAILKGLRVTSSSSVITMIFSDNDAFLNGVRAIELSYIVNDNMRWRVSSSSAIASMKRCDQKVHQDHQYYHRERWDYVGIEGDIKLIHNGNDNDAIMKGLRAISSSIV